MTTFRVQHGHFEASSLGTNQRCKHVTFNVYHSCNSVRSNFETKIEASSENKTCFERNKQDVGLYRWINVIRHLIRTETA